MTTTKYSLENIPEHCLVAEQLRQLSRLLIATQKYRIKYKRSFDMKKTLLDDEIIKEVFASLNADGAKKDETEKQIETLMKKLLKKHPWWPWFESIRGVAHITAASLIGECDGLVFKSIEKGTEMEEKDEMNRTIIKMEKLGYGRTFESTSDLWSFAGYGVKDGKAVRMTHGQAANWNKYLKVSCFKMMDSTIKSNGDYRKYYDERKVYEKKRDPEMSDGHAHNRAMRRAIKIFLADFKHECLEKDQRGVVKNH